MTGGDASSFFSPLPPFSGKRRVDAADQNAAGGARPLVVYLPGIDGSGVAAESQFRRLRRSFDLVCFRVPTMSTEDFSTLTSRVASYCEFEINELGRDTVILLGESFGGLLACGVALRAPCLVDRLVLVNPATSFDVSVWSRLKLGDILTEIGRRAPDAWPMVPLALAPVLGDPMRMAGISGGNLLEQAERARDALTRVLPRMTKLSEILPPETLAFKLRLLSTGCAHVNEVGLERINQRTIVIASGKDNVLPSEDEGRRLSRILPRAELVALEDASHAALQEAGVDLLAIMERNAFDVTPRWTSRRRRRRRGASVEIEYPTPREIEAARRGAVATISALTSPVFLSTREDGSIVRGLGGVPVSREDSRPTLFVGNHQTYAYDTGLIINQFLKEQDRLVRGLAHPVLFRSSARRRRASGASEGGGPSRNGGENTAISTVFTRFGAVEVTPKNFYSLLASGESVLLFPGGVREAYKRRNEEYQTKWPEQPEFVRMAQRFGADIVPFGAIGIDDGINMLLDTDDLLSIPFIGQRVLENSEWMPVPLQRRRVNEASTTAAVPRSDELFVQPLSVPRNLTPQRMYFHFGRPIRMDSNSPETDANALYRHVKGEVDASIAYLLRERENDDFNDFGKRIAYELLNGKQAPTFNLNA